MIDPKEIDEVKFETALRGYSKKEVDIYLEELSQKAAESNAEYEALERKYAALKIQVEDIKTAVDEDRARLEKLQEEAAAALESARAEAGAIISSAKKEEEKMKLLTKFESDKAVAAAKREAMQIIDEAKQKANTVNLASHRAADKVISEAKRKATAICESAKRRGNEIMINAQASVEGERRLFMQLREEILSRSGELSRLLSSQLTEIAKYVDRARRTEFGDIPEEREDLIRAFSEKDVPKLSAVSGEDAPARENPVPHSEEEVTLEETAEEKALKTLLEEEGVESPEIEDHLPEFREDDDTYDFLGVPAQKPTSSHDIPTAEYNGLPHGEESGRNLSPDELDRIFSFDVEEIMNDE